VAAGEVGAGGGDAQPRVGLVGGGGGVGPGEDDAGGEELTALLGWCGSEGASLGDPALEGVRVGLQVAAASWLRSISATGGDAEAAGLLAGEEQRALDHQLDEAVVEQAVELVRQRQQVGRRDRGAAADGPGDALGDAAALQVPAAALMLDGEEGVVREVGAALEGEHELQQLQLGAGEQGLEAGDAPLPVHAGQLAAEVQEAAGEHAGEGRQGLVRGEAELQQGLVVDAGEVGDGAGALVLGEAGLGLLDDGELDGGEDGVGDRADGGARRGRGARRGGEVLRSRATRRAMPARSGAAARRGTRAAAAAGESAMSRAWRRIAGVVAASGQSSRRIAASGGCTAAAASSASQVSMRVGAAEATARRSRERRGEGGGRGGDGERLGQAAA
jgi:hypothetical protein